MNQMRQKYESVARMFRSRNQMLVAWKNITNVQIEVKKLGNWNEEFF